MSSAMRWRAGAASLAALLLSVLAAACSNTSLSTSATSTTGAIGAPVQLVVKTAIQQDIGVLDSGVLTYSRLTTMNTGESTEFSVSVTDTGMTPKGVIPAQEVSALIGRVVYPDDVPTGGYVGVQITSCVGLSCQSQSTPTQAVAVVNQVAWWYWLVTAVKSGPAVISLTAATYEGLSTKVLKAETIIVNVNVRSSKSYQPPSRAPAVSSSAPAANQGTNSGGPSTPVWVLVTVGVAFIGVAGAVAAALISRGGSSKGGSSKGSGSGSAA